jgi:hypothetical protein
MVRVISRMATAVTSSHLRRRCTRQRGSSTPARAPPRVSSDRARAIDADQDFDNLAKRAAANVEIARYETEVRALWADIRRLTRLGNAASTQYQRPVVMESQLGRWKLPRERIRATRARTGKWVPPLDPT